MVLTTDSDVRLAHSRDASGVQLIPESVARASDAHDVIEIMRSATATGIPVTPAGAQTSMTAASITDRGTLLSLGGMKRIIDVDTELCSARVEPGVTIGDLNRALRDSGLHFAPDPTSENEATIGGAIACNASGARTLRYGPTRAHVTGVSVVYADGELARHSRPQLEKNTVGFAFAQDPVDWFVGSEGTLGIVVEAELRLEPLPRQPVGMAIPFSSLDAALGFIVSARRQLDEGTGRSALCLELFDAGALAIAGIASGRPWPEAVTALVYLEDDAGDAPDSDELFDAWLSLAESHEAVSADIRVFDSAQSLRDARVMRHAVPSAMNERGESYRQDGGRKVSTDWAVPYQLLAEALATSREACLLHGAPEPVTYGHAGNGHPHQNFIARNSHELEVTYAAIEETLTSVLGMGGTVSAEHGLGKLKRQWIDLQLGRRQIDAMRALKHALDPLGILSPGNVL